MTLVLSVIAGILPMMIYPIFLYWMDRFEKEPLLLLASAFIWGFIPAAILSLISQLILGFPFLLVDETGALADLVGGSVLAPVTEEIFKGMAVWIIFHFWKNEFDGVFDGIIYGGLVGFGFAAIENILYFVGFGLSVELFIFRAVLFGLNHAFFTSLIGIGFGLARHSRSALYRISAPVIGLIAAITMHALHNTTVAFIGAAPALILLTFLANYSGLFFVFVIMLLAIRRERRWLEEQLHDEIAMNTLSETQYAIAFSSLRRIGTRFSALSRAGIGAWLVVGRYFNKMTELAYKKHAQSRRGERGASDEVIEMLRNEVASMSQDIKGVTG